MWTNSVCQEEKAFYFSHWQIAILSSILSSTQNMSYDQWLTGMYAAS